MLNGLNNRGYVDLPRWAHSLYAPYWLIRVEGRNKAKRRKSYREVEKIKLDLVERGYCPELINAICRYLSNFRKSSAKEAMAFG